MQLVEEIVIQNYLHTTCSNNQGVSYLRSLKSCFTPPSPSPSKFLQLNAAKNGMIVCNNIYEVGLATEIKFCSSTSLTSLFSLKKMSLQANQP